MKCNRMHKFVGIFLVLLQFLSATMPCYAAGTPVFDISNWLAAIDRYYQLYDMVQQNITMIEQNYETIQHSIEQAKSWKWQDVEWDGDLDFRNEMKNATHQVNRQLTNIRKIKDTLTTENIRVGNTAFSLADLAGVGNPDKDISKAIQAYEDEIELTRNEASNMIEKGLSDDEKKWIWSKYGISPRNYYFVQQTKAQLNKAAEGIFARATDAAKENLLSERNTAVQEIIKKIMNYDQNGDSDLTEKNILQMQAYLTAQTIEQLQSLSEAMNDFYAYSAWKTKYDEEVTQKKAEEEQKASEHQRENADFVI